MLNEAFVIFRALIALVLFGIGIAVFWWSFDKATDLIIVWMRPIIAWIREWFSPTLDEPSKTVNKCVGDDGEAMPENGEAGTDRDDTSGILENEAGDNAPLPGFPTTPKGREKWKRSYGIILEKREEYLESYRNFDTDEPKPSVDDLRDALANMPEWKKRPSTSTVQRIAKAGDEGYLE